MVNRRGRIVGVGVGVGVCVVITLWVLRNFLLFTWHSLSLRTSEITTSLPPCAEVRGALIPFPQPIFAVKSAHVRIGAEPTDAEGEVLGVSSPPAAS